MDTAAGTDFFVSYTGADEAWATWIAVTLEQAKYRTFSQVLDIRPGHDFVHEMQRASATAARTVASATEGGSGRLERCSIKGKL